MSSKAMGRVGYSGSSSDRSARSPDAATFPDATASDQLNWPVTIASQVAASHSMTFGGVPRVWRGPSTHCVTPNGGTRTSTELPGALAVTSSSE